MRRRKASLPIKLGIVRLILFQNVVDGGQQHPGNSDDGLFVPTTFSQRKIAAAHFGELLGTNGAVMS